VRRHDTALVPPASTAKLLTAAAALSVLGPRHRLTTSAVLTGDTVVLVGGGDPTLTQRPTTDYPPFASLPDLARQTAAALRSHGVDHPHLGYDESLYAGPTTAVGWPASYVEEGDVAPVVALQVDEGHLDPRRRARVSDPAAYAAQVFRADLKAAGIDVAGSATRQAAPDTAATLAAVQSPPLGALVEYMLTESDNDLAEALARQVSLATGGPASFAGGAAAVRAAVGRLGVAPAEIRMLDGSGLSKQDRVAPDALLTVLSLAGAADQPRLRPILTGLPVAGFTGTLVHRFHRAPAASAAGVVRAKTGTLSGVARVRGDRGSGALLPKRRAGARRRRRGARRMRLPVTSNAGGPPPTYRG
jgi:D-alanyl-D-alanine carboxypeptidase/D-alanyl-D-alanine-endopeptidase (penicillin-binding protein 4)